MTVFESCGTPAPGRSGRADEASHALTSDTHRVIDAVWRIESARLIAGLARIVRDVGLAEDLAQDALVAALEQWPESGVPRNPGAWLMAIAKRRAIDFLRREERLGHKIDELGHELETGAVGAVPEIGAAPGEDICDDLLRLVCTACHPVLSTEARVALTLRLLGGLTTEEIARAFLVSESTIAQRIIRAKRTLQAAIAACHARARTLEQTDWARIAALYEALAQLAPSPIVELNRAVALSMAFGPATGLALVDELTSEPSLKGYHLLPSVRGDLLTKLGRLPEAREEFERAAALTRNRRERALLLERAAACARGSAPPPMR